jgi:hypothetical protein
MIQIKGQALFKGEIITKMQKWGGVTYKSSSQEPLSQKSSIYMNAF